MMSRLTIVVSLGLVGVAGYPVRVTPRPVPLANPVIIMQTQDKGTFEMELFAADAPKSVAHLLDLFKRDFYRGFRFHRVTATLVQIGDPQSRNARLEASWGTLGSGAPIGVAEISRTRKHIRGTVGLAHSGNPAGADSQIYIMKVASPSLDGKHTIVGQVTVGMAVVDKLQKGDILKVATIKAAAPK